MADLVTVAAAMAAASLLRWALPGWDSAGRVSRHVAFGALSLPLWASAFSHYGLYSARKVTTRLDEFNKIVHATGSSVLIMVVGSVVTDSYLSRSWLALTCGIAVVAVTAEREVIRRMFSFLRCKGRFLRPVVIVGANEEAIAVCRELASSPWLGYRPLGFIDDTAPIGEPLVQGVSVIGRTADVLAVVSECGASGVVVATTGVSTAVSNRVTRELLHAGVYIELTSSLKDLASERLSVRPLGRCPVIQVEPARRGGWQDAAKRTFDIFVTSVALVMLAPTMALIAALIKLDSRGPVLFRQHRVGRNGDIFTVWKFRTMVERAEQMVIDLRDANEADGPLFKIRKDPRVTRVGRILRSTSLDELPQFWNVLRGQMSLVGPRPALPAEMEAWTPELRNRLRVKPGITGMWQVSGRSDCSFADYMRLDLYYVDNWSLLTDLAIVAKTVPTLLLRRGAY
ncbi:MAG: sugar transferase [Actinomycetota bacterium]|nr:sugar transferase [Actinomycetota bacterium]